MSTCCYFHSITLKISFKFISIMPSAFSNINMAFLTPIHISTHHITQTFLSPTCCTQPPTPPPAQPQLPTNLPSTITFAAAAASKALATGATRIKVTALIPGLNPQLEEAVPYSSQTLYTLARGIAISTPALRTLSTTLLFPSSGDAAAAAAFYRREISEDASVRTASYFRRDGKEGRVSTDANVIVAPISSRGDRVMDDLESVISEAPDAIWVLLNADLDVDRASVGMAENERRASFIRAFINAFYFRNLVRYIISRIYSQCLSLTASFFLSLKLDARNLRPWSAARCTFHIPVRGACMRSMRKPWAIIWLQRMTICRDQIV